MLVVIRRAVTSQCRGQMLTRRDDAGCLPVQSVLQQSSRLEKTDLTKNAAAFSSSSCISGRGLVKSDGKTIPRAPSGAAKDASSKKGWKRVAN